MKKFKKVSLLMLALVMLLTLCACNSGSSGSAPASTSPSGGSAEPAKPTGEVYEFIFNCIETPESAHADALNPWAKELEEASNGRIKVTVYYGGVLGTNDVNYDLIKNGAFDMCWSGVNLVDHDLDSLSLTSLPGIFNDIVKGTDAVNALVEKRADVKEEIENCPARVIAIHLGGTMPFATTKPIESSADFKGLRMRTGNAVCVEYLKNLNCEPMQFAASDAYENLTKGVCDGVFNDWVFFDANKLWEAAPYMMDVNVGAACSLVLMNRNSYDRMDDECKAIFDEVTSKLGGALAEAFANKVNLGKEHAAADGGSVYAPSDDVIAYMDEAIAKTNDWWIKDAIANGYDGQGIYDDMTALFAEYGAN